MLRTALIGYPAIGKTTLFQLMTGGARRAARGPRQARGDARRGPRAGPAPRRAHGDVQPAQARAGDGRVRRHPGPGVRAPAPMPCSTWRRTATPTRSCTCCGRSPTRPFPMRRDRSIRAATPGRWRTSSSSRTSRVVEKRLERLAKDLKKTRTAGARARAGRSCVALQGRSSRTARRCACWSSTATIGARLRGFQFLSAKPLLLVLNVDEARPRPRGSSRSIERHGLADLAAGPQTRAVALCAKIELEIAQLEPADAAAFLADLGLAANRASIASSARATSCSATSRSSRSARTSAARGRSRAARRRRPPPARSTRISRAGSSAPRSSPTTA